MLALKTVCRLLSSTTVTSASHRDDLSSCALRFGWRAHFFYRIPYETRRLAFVDLRHEIFDERLYQLTHEDLPSQAEGVKAQSDAFGHLRVQLLERVVVGHKAFGEDTNYN